MRFEMKRWMTEVSTRFGVIPVKVGEVGKVGVDRALFAKAKPEFDACVRAAEQRATRGGGGMIHLLD
jgi:uncharacterized protein (DUF111 family)